jgi:predicted HTH domain antitoxin
VSKPGGTLLDRELEATVRSGLFSSRAEAVQEALGLLFAGRPEYRLEAGIEMFRSGEVTLSRAAEIAGLNECRFGDLLRQRGIARDVEIDASDISQQARSIGRRRS